MAPAPHRELKACLYGSPGFPAQQKLGRVPERAAVLAVPRVVLEVQPSPERIDRRQ